jgi:hypothetical protein
MGIINMPCNIILELIPINKYLFFFIHFLSGFFVLLRTLKQLFFVCCEIFVADYVSLSIDVQSKVRNCDSRSDMKFFVSMRRIWCEWIVM